MSDRISADPGRLEAYSAATRATIAPALDAAATYSAALRRYQQAPNDLSTRCHVDHRGAVEGVLSDLATLDELPEAFARALRALDGRQGPALVLSAPHDARFDAAVDAALDDASAGADDLRRAAEEDADGETPVWRIVWNAYDHPAGTYGSVVNLVNIGRWGRATSRLQRVEAMAGMSHLDLRWTGLNRAGRRSLARELRARGRRLLPGARTAADAAEDAMLARRGPLAGLRTRVPPRLAATAGRLAVPLGGIGIALSGYDAYQHGQDGRWVDAGFAGAGAGGGMLLLMAGGPVTLGIGSALVLGSVAWEYREEIADGARWVADKGGDVVDAIGDGLGDLGDGIASLGGGARDFVGGLFD